MVKLIVVDVDGTLLGKKKSVPSENIAALNEARATGIKIAIATGRNLKRAIDIARTIGIDKHQEYLICLNGGVTYKFDAAGEPQLIEETLFSVNDVKYIYDTAVKTKVNCFSYSEDPKITYVIKNRGVFIWFMKKISKRKAKIYGKDEMNQRAYKILACGKRANMNNLVEKVKQKKYEVYSWSYVSDKTVNIEISPVGVDKKHALEKVAREYAIQPSEVMYFGDGQNDARSIKWAGLGIAMGNASSEVKKVADDVTIHHKCGGVAHKIREIILKDN
ncbi:HAD superfamily hydrolase [Spiroplasma clarkii]|uniref:HAD superfamily hydrolase n=1 Tax=Spiroplasma clarkii TaxID=2139 RepID=A0A1Y0L2I2_9MOLU|nr:HAD family hydrolase [Spiroplasma clarkii]ARU92221.1 HAD superfamily hydrolase [Spiroplasma clarkii]ATX71543.1 HAD superfamily hydrolase [Spiroplasma clarkii]